MDYIATIRISSRSFSQGRGTSDISLTKDLSLREVLDYLESHPNDGFMHCYLDKVISSDKKSSIAEVVRRFQIKPSIITFGILAQTDTQEYPELLEVLTTVKNQRQLLKFLEQHYNIAVRGFAQQDYLMLQSQWDSIFRENRDNHTPFSDTKKIKFEVPVDFLAEIKNTPNYSPVNQFVASSINSSVATGTSIRTISPNETYERIEKLDLDNIMTEDTQLVGYDFCGTYLIMIPWNLKLAVSMGKHTYTLISKGGSGGKGLDKTSALVSGLMEVLERYSAGFGCTPDFFESYEETQDFRRAKQSQLEQESGNVLDLNKLSLKIPYQDHELHWVKGIEQRSDGSSSIYVPAQIVYLFPNLDEVNVVQATSNGLASGNSMEEAKLHSLLEIIERDGDYNMFYSPDRVFKLTASNKKIAEVLNRYQKRGLTVQVLDLTTEFGIPTYRAFVQTNGQILSGSGTHLDGKIAVVRAICELSTKCFVWEKKYLTNSWAEIKNPSADMKQVSYDNLPNYSSGNVVTDLRITEATLTANGYNPIYVNLTRSDIGIPVVRTIVPGLEMHEGTSKRQFKHFLDQTGIKLKYLH